MKKIIFMILSFFLLSSCSSSDSGKNLNIENAKLAHQKFSNVNNDLSYEEYKSLVVEYGKNSKFPDIN
tara:strand:+ start:395 stop:598 length:204 start_codon:yes stop_codon:yes gene_type:complete